MTDTAETSRDILKRYADTLIANVQASTQEELDEAADDLIYVTGEMEARGKDMAQLIHELLAGAGAASR